MLQLIARGCSNQEISEQLFISLHTVKTHASHINSKLGVERRTQAVARRRSWGCWAEHPAPQNHLPQKPASKGRTRCYPGTKPSNLRSAN